MAATGMAGTEPGQNGLTPLALVRERELVYVAELEFIHGLVAGVFLDRINRIDRI